MTHWSEKYIGRPWINGEFDCADLVREVVLEIRGIQVDLPADREWRGLEPQALIDLGESVAAATATPIDGDCVLMKIVGNRRSLGSHVGVFGAVEGSPWVLHANESFGAMFCPVSHLPRLQFSLVGYYRWI